MIDGCSRQERLEQLQQLQESLSKEPESLNGVVEGLFAVHPTFNDQELRSAAGDLVAELSTRNKASFKTAVCHECSKKTWKPASDVFTLLEWTNKVLLKTGADRDLMLVQAQLLENAVFSERERLARSAIRNTRYTMSHFARKYGVDAYADILSKNSPLSVVLLFSTLADAGAESASEGRPAIEARVSALMPTWCDAYVATVLGARRPFPRQLLEFLSPAVELVDQASFDQVLSPAISKALLRAPEIVLATSLPVLLTQLTSRVNVTLSACTFINSVLTNISSSNPDTRSAAAHCLELVLEKCSQFPAADGPINEAIKFLEKSSSAEQRALIAGALAKVPFDLENPSSYTKLVGALDKVAAKESSETAVKGVANACVNLFPLTVKRIITGIKDKGRPALRREWVCALARHLSLKDLDRLDDTDKKELVELLRSILGVVVSNVGNAINTKQLAAGYAAAAILRDESGVVLLEDPKIYTRLSRPEDFEFAVKAAAVLARASFAGALVYLTCSANVPTDAKLPALNTTRQIYTDNAATVGPALVAAMTEGLERYPSLSQLTKLFGTRLNIKNIRTGLVDLLVLSHHPKARTRIGWVGICLHAHADPGELVNSYHDEMLQAIRKAPKQLETAGNEALATIAFIAPKTVGPHVASYLEQALAPIKVSEEEVLIYRTAPGELALTLEVLKKNNAEARNGGSDKKMDAWEKQLRKEIAEKHGKKLSKEDLALLKEQDQVRDEITEKVATVERAVACINTLAKPVVDNGKDVWFPVAVKCLISQGKTELGEPAVDCLLNLSRLVTTRFSNLQRTVGIALTWKLGLSKAGSSKIVSDVLYRTKFLSDQRPLDTLSFVYMLPLLIRVLAKSGGALSEEDEEQLLLVLSILASQAEELAIVDRGNLVHSIISILERNKEKAKDIKDTLQRIAQSVVFSREELLILVSATVNKDSYVRTAVLEIIDSEVDLSDFGFAPEIWINRFGSDAGVAHTIWEESAMALPSDSLSRLVEFLGSDVRDEASKSYAAIVTEDQTYIDQAISQLTSLYKVATMPPAPEYDEFGIEIKKQYGDTWTKRSGYLQSLYLTVPIFRDEQVSTVASFVNEIAIFDVHDIVYKDALSLGLQILTIHGASHLNDLLAKIEKSVDQKELPERVSEAYAVFYGSLARHLPESDPRLVHITQKLITALSTPSESVQFSVAECLAQLAPKVDISRCFESLSAQLYGGVSTDIRRGAAYGIAGLTKGMGIVVLSDHDIIRGVFEGMEDKKSPSRREASQLAVACMSRCLGKTFEPYALELLPLVLAGLGDLNNTVREAAAYAAKNIMKHTTRFGIEKQIPLALDRMSDTAWRSKKGAVELLGSMAYLDPQQLSTSLSVIVPEIVGALSDTHREVRGAAKQSLSTFGEVIKNPEIQKLTPELLDAISDPTKHTETALEALLRTKFTHYIDSPSLALIIHVVKRGLRDRSANVKRRACQVVGNMSILTEAQDIVTYLPELMPDLQVSLTDPVATTSSTASKALGVLVEKLGEGYFPQVIPNMLETLKDPAKVGDRWGCAQGLSEVIHGLGIAKLEELLPLIMQNCSSPKPWIRQSFILMLLFLPASFGPSITPYLSQMTPAVIQGLADTVDDVRENALKAGRLIVRNFASRAIDLLLPELELGLSDENYRIRLSSVELTGDLLFQLAGVSKNDAEDVIVSGKVQASLIEVLGIERRDRILASLFICRADTSGEVRSSSYDVWMSIVANTPRMVKEILPTLAQMIVKRLSSDVDELQKIAARALGELVRRVSASLVQLLPTLQDLSADPDAKQGICIGITELIKSTPIEVLQEHEKEVTLLIKGSLTDPNTRVREAASQAFDALQESLGEVAHDILPELMAQMEAGDDGAVAALRDMMVTSPDLVVPAVVPKLLEAPVTEKKLSYLADLCAIAGECIRPYTKDIVDASFAVLAETDNSELVDTVDRILAIDAPQTHLLHIAQNGEPAFKKLAFAHTATLFNNRPEDIELEYAGDWTSVGILALEDSHADVVKAAWELLASLTSNIEKATLVRLVEPAHRTLKITVEPLPGFQLPKGPSCVLPIFLQGLVAGTNAEKQASALAISDLVRRVEPDNLKPCVTQITGPLIRVAGEKNSSDVKAATIYTLGTLLGKIPAFLKPFLPQLQRTFTKSLADPSSSLLRERAARALGTLITLQNRIDPLAKEVIVGVRSSDDSGVRVAMLQALLEITLRAGKNLGDPIKFNVLELLDELDVPASDDRQKILLGQITASVVELLPDQAVDLAHQIISGPDKVMALLTANALLVYAKGQLEPLAGEISDFFIAESVSHQSAESELGVKGLGKYLLSNLQLSEGDRAIETILACVAKDESRSADTRRLSLIILRAVARERPEILEPYLDKLIVPLFSAVRDTLVPVKLAAENTFLEVFKFIERGDSSYFESWLEKAQQNGVVDSPTLQRSLSEYVKRVAMRHAVARREQLEAGASDGFSEDLQEVWQVGVNSSADDG